MHLSTHLRPTAAKVAAGRRASAALLVIATATIAALIIMCYVFIQPRPLDCAVQARVKTTRTGAASSALLRAAPRRAAADNPVCSFLAQGA